MKTRDIFDEASIGVTFLIKTREQLLNIFGEPIPEDENNINQILMNYGVNVEDRKWVMRFQPMSENTDETE